jgi:pyridoxamine 5'-phosphate oxidase
MHGRALPDDLDAVLADGWARLGRGAKDRRSPFHTPVVATGGRGGVRQRVMVLRTVDRAQATLRFHSDARAAKLAAIGDAPSVSVLGYDAGARVQVTLSGTARLGDAAVSDAAWAATALYSRRCYLAHPAPGTAVDSALSGLSDDLAARAPEPQESEAGRANFAVLLITVDRLEWLELNARGNRRAAFVRDGDAWRGTWLIP